MTFTEYLMKQKITDNPRGDFIEDFQYEVGRHQRKKENFPNLTTWDDLQEYLKRNNACDGALEAAKEVWQEYQNTK